MRAAWGLACLLVFGASARAADFEPAGYVRLALGSSPEAASALESFRSAAAQWRSAIGEAWLPVLSAQAQANPYGINPAWFNRFHAWRLNASDVTYNAALSLNLFNSFLDRRKIRQAALARELARVSLDFAHQGRAFEALRAYLDLYLKLRLKQVAEADLSAQKAQYDLTQDLYKNGMKSKSDLLKSETDWRSSQLRVLGAEADRLKSLYHFNILIGRSPEEPALLADLPSVATAAVTAAAAVSTALQNRPEVLKSALELRQAEVAAEAALQRLFPTLNASANWSVTKAATFDDPLLGTGRRPPAYTLALSLSLPVGYNAYSQLEGRLASRSDLRRAAAERGVLERRVREEVYFARIGLDQALESHRFGREREIIARTNLELVVQQYRQGSADVIRLAQARADYLQAQVEQLRLLHDAQLRWTEYRLAIGEKLWEE